MSWIKKEDIGGNNFLLSVGAIFFVFAILVFVNTKINLLDLNFEIVIKDLTFRLKDTTVFIISIFSGCGFFIGAFIKG